jgi:hypothetical protein
VERYRDNPNAPAVKFIRVRGRVIPIFKGNTKGTKPRVAARIVEDQLHAMGDAVNNAEAGKRIIHGYGTSQHVIGTKSTFPEFYSKIGFKNKSDFKVVLEKQGIRHDRLIDAAVHDVKVGENYGFHLPDRSKDLQVATRQIFDNKNVVFRKLNGKVVPMKIKGSSTRVKNTTVSDWDFNL